MNVPNTLAAVIDREIGPDHSRSMSSEIQHLKDVAELATYLAGSAYMLSIPTERPDPNKRYSLRETRESDRVGFVFGFAEMMIREAKMRAAQLKSSNTWTTSLPTERSAAER